MSAPAKFLFDTLLDAPAAPPPIAHDDVELLKEQHAAELARVQEKALQQGREEGRLKAEETIERELFKKLDQLVGHKEEFQQQIDAKLRAIHSSSVRLSLTIAQKLASSLLKRYPAQHIEQFFQNSMSLLPDETSLRLHVAPGLAGTLQPRLEALLERNGQENALQMIEDDAIEGVQCRLVWKDGGIEQNTDGIFTQIDKMIETCLYSETPNSETSISETSRSETPQSDIGLSEITPADSNARAI